MTTQLSTKLAAFAVALMVNGMMMGGVGYLFSAQLHQQTAARAIATTAARAAAMTMSARAAIPTI